jgi:hypothetical protein
MLGIAAKIGDPSDRPRMFLTLMIVGLIGLAMMALPAFHGHGHAPHANLSHGHSAHLHLGHGAGSAHGAGPAHGATSHAGHAGSSVKTAITAKASPGAAAARGAASLLRFFPSPRAVFSSLALFGAFANAFLHAAHLSALLSALAAILPTLIVEHFVVRPVWNLVFRYEGAPSSPLDALLFAEARAVVPFRNGRGVVSTVRDGRLVQLSAQLVGDQTATPVKVGDRLRIEEVHGEREQVIVSVFDD